MKILMVITEGDLGGAQRHVLDISRELSKRGHELLIAIGGDFTELSDAAANSILPIETVRLQNVGREIRLAKDFRGLLEIYKLIRSWKPDIVHCHSSKVGVLASIAGRVAGAKVVYTAHGFVFCEELPLVTRLVYLLAEKISTLFRHKVIAVSQSDADAARKNFIVSSKKLTIIPNGLDLSIEDRLLDVKSAREMISSWAGADMSDAKIILSIANFYPAKNLSLLVQSFESVLARIPEARLVLVGDGKERPVCERLVEQNPKLHEKVFFTGKRADAFQVLRGADVVALSSTKEGMPYVVLEAKFAGTPVVATRVGGIPEMGEGSDLKLVVPHSPEMLSEALVQMLRTEKQARGHLPWHFTLTGMVDAIEAVYHEVV